MKRSLMIGAFLLGTGSALAMPGGMGKSGDMAARPLMVEDLPKGTVTVRVGRGSLSNVAAGVEVKATLTSPDGKTSARSEKTQTDGRATFSNLPEGSQFQAEAVVDGQTLKTAGFAIPAQGGTRLMLVSEAGPAPEAEAEDEAEAPPSMPPAQANPHGAGHGHMQQAPTLVMLLGKIEPKPGLPPGTVELQILDAQGAPVARQAVRLGRMVKPEQGVTWGDGTTDDKGTVRFEKQEIDEAKSYIALAEREGMRLGSPMFNLPKDSGMAGELRIPSTTKDVSVLRVSGDSKILIDLREDKLEIMENLVVENTSDQIFQSERGGVAVPLPAEANSVEVIAGGSPLDTTKEGGLFLPANIPPSQPTQMPVQARFGFYIPTAKESSVTIRQPMPLGMEGPVVMIPAAAGLTLGAPGMKALPSQDDDRGGKMLVFELPSVPRNGVLTLSLVGLPSPNALGKTVAGILAAALFLGAVLGIRRPKSASKAAKKRESLLAELVQVERARETAPDPQLDDRRASLIAALVALEESPDGTGK
jgi:hypothetical protein